MRCVISKERATGVARTGILAKNGIVPEAGTYVPNTTYAIITTEGGGTVTFDSVTAGSAS
jgi:hypothetical protein